MAKQSIKNLTPELQSFCDELNLDFSNSNKKEKKLVLLSPKSTFGDEMSSFCYSIFKKASKFVQTGLQALEPSATNRR